MNTENDPVGKKVALIIAKLRQDGVEIKGGSDYNRIFEAFYDLLKKPVKNNFKIMAEVTGHHQDLLETILLNEVVITPNECELIIDKILN